MGKGAITQKLVRIFYIKCCKSLWLYNITFREQIQQELPMKPANPIYLTLMASIWMLLLPHAQSQQLQELTLDKLKQMRQMFDGVHNFIILDHSLLALIQTLLPKGDRIAYYTYNCSKNSSLLTACSTGHTPALLIFNKVVIGYEVYLQLQASQMSSNVLKWISKSIDSGSRKNMQEKQIMQIIKQKGDIFIMIENKTIYQLEIGYNILAKQFTFQNFIYISDIQYAQRLNLTIGDFIYIKTKQMPENVGLGDLIGDDRFTTHLPKQLNKRYDYMRLFVLQNIFTRGFTKQIDNVHQLRFENLRVRQPNKQGNYQQKRTVLVFCDLELQCLDYWNLIDSQLIRAQKKQNTDYQRLIYRSEIINNIQVLEVYEHVKLRNRKLPFILVLDGEDPQVPNLPLRYIKQLDIKIPSPIMQIQDFLNSINNRQQNKEHLSSGIPKKNGFYGKGSEKVVQKLSFETYREKLQQAKQKKIFYLLYITAFDFDCQECISFYSQFKKFAAFMNAEGNTDIVFGVFDLSKDQIDLKYLKNVPEVYLFTPNSDTPVQFRSRYDFQSLRRFIKKQMQKNDQNKRNASTDNAANSQL